MLESYIKDCGYKVSMELWRVWWVLKIQNMIIISEQIITGNGAHRIRPCKSLRPSIVRTRFPLFTDWGLGLTMLICILHVPIFFIVTCTRSTCPVGGNRCDRGRIMYFVLWVDAQDLVRIMYRGCVMDDDPIVMLIWFMYRRCRIRRIQEVHIIRTMSISTPTRKHWRIGRTHHRRRFTDEWKVRVHWRYAVCMPSCTTITTAVVSVDPLAGQQRCVGEWIQIESSNRIIIMLPSKCCAMCEIRLRLFNVLSASSEMRIFFGRNCTA